MTIFGDHLLGDGDDLCFPELCFPLAPWTSAGPSAQQTISGPLSPLLRRILNMILSKRLLKIVDRFQSDFTNFLRRIWQVSFTVH